VGRIDLVTVGETFEDLIFVGLPHLPRPGEELKSGRLTATVGGGAAITAVAAARLGARVAAITALSTDAAARLRRERIVVTNLRRAGEPHAVTVALSTMADRSFVTFNGVNAWLQPRLASALTRRRGRPVHVHFALSPDRCAAWTRIVARLRARGVSTSWDFGWDESLPRRDGFGSLVAETDIVFANEPESALYARALRRARTAIVKLGSRGSRWIARDLDLRAAAPSVRVVDTTGAGDAFNGGFLYALLTGHQPRACLEIGNFVGAQSTRAPGGIDALPARVGGPKRRRRSDRPIRSNRP
jgi:sugar/nucleoside kinase (ribokinase family)